MTKNVAYVHVDRTFFLLMVAHFNPYSARRNAFAFVFANDDSHVFLEHPDFRRWIAVGQVAPLAVKDLLGESRHRLWINALRSAFSDHLTLVGIKEYLEVGSNQRELVEEAQHHQFRIVNITEPRTLPEGWDTDLMRCTFKLGNKPADHAAFMYLWETQPEIKQAWLQLMYSAVRHGMTKPTLGEQEAQLAAQLRKDGAQQFIPTQPGDGRGDDFVRWEGGFKGGRK